MKTKFNYLEMVPSVSPAVSLLRGPEGNLQIKLARRGFFYRLAKLLKPSLPSSFVIDTEIYGQAVLDLIDGKRDLLAIGALLRKKFGGEVDPLYPRLAQFCRILQANNICRLRRRSYN